MGLLNAENEEKAQSAQSQRTRNSQYFAPSQKTMGLLFLYFYSKRLIVMTYFYSLILSMEFNILSHINSRF